MTGYVPNEPIGLEDFEKLTEYLITELRAVSGAFQETDALDLRPRGAEPRKPRDGMIVYADGVGWDPGLGLGLYVRKSGSWVKLIEESSWTAYTPTVTAGVGTLTTVASSGRYRKIGRTVFYSMSITITTNGTGAAYIQATLPSTVTSQGNHASVGKGHTNKELSGLAAASTNALVIQFYDGTYPGADGAIIVMQGTYEE